MIFLYLKPNVASGYFSSNIFVSSRLQILKPIRNGGVIVVHNVRVSYINLKVHLYDEHI